MSSTERTYIAIDLKSFYASVECQERQLDPLTTNLVVADPSRTEKTICLAVSPSLKAHGIPGRARLFEVMQRVREVNAMRRAHAPRRTLTGESADAAVLAADPTLALSYITAPPRMALYLEYSARIYQVYLKYIAPEDMHVYSIDEVFIDATSYLRTYGMTARELAQQMIRDVLQTTGITAAAGIGTNLYLCKVAMDIVAKHVRPDRYGVRIASLTEMTYRRLLWSHRPLTDFWRVGRGYAKKLEAQRLFTMGDIARCSLGKPNEYFNENLLYKLFGINAELLIDHAWGWEPCGMAEIKAYKPAAKCISSGQVLQCPYSFEKTRLIVREMTDQLALDLVERQLVTDQLTLTVGYDIDNLTDPKSSARYTGEVTTDYYGRKIPKHAHGTANLKTPTSSAKLLLDAVLPLYDRIMDRNLLARRITITANHLKNESETGGQCAFEQLDLFTGEKERAAQDAALRREKRMQQAVLAMKHKYGKNAVFKGMDLQEGATALERNGQIGGHKA